MTRTLTMATVVTVIIGLLVATAFFWHSMRDVYGTFSSYSVDIEHSRIFTAQRIETMLREGRVDDALAHLQDQRDRGVVQLGSQRRYIDAATWRMGRNQYTIDKLDAAIEKEVEYRRVNGETNGKLSDRVRSILEAYNE